MRTRRLLATAATALLIGGASLMAAPSASAANQVWIQQVERASAEAPCDIPAVEGEAAGWSEWGPSWAQWPNDGEGGWVCQRSITWAKDTPPPAGGGGSGNPATFCVLAEVPTYYLDFEGGYSLPEGSQVYDDADCTSEYGFAAWDTVYAPAPYDPSTLCLAAFGTDEDLRNFGADVWGCRLGTT